MSDSSVSDLTRAVERLSLATDRLADRISSDSAPVVPPTITLRAKSRASDPDLSHLIVLALGNRGLEDGPCDLPSGVVDFCSSRITTRPPGVVARAGRAFNGGFWAWIALETDTPYVQEHPLPYANNCHWVVLRSSHPEPFRTTALRDVGLLCDRSDPFLILEVFDSLTEVEVFCATARVDVPAWKCCRSRG